MPGIVACGLPAEVANGRAMLIDEGQVGTDENDLVSEKGLADRG